MAGSTSSGEQVGRRSLIEKASPGSRVADLVATLDQFNVPAAEQQELLGILGPLRGDIVEVEAPTTGTPLPDSYEPAASLPRA